MDGDSVAVTLVEVGYGPGGSSAPHHHLCFLSPELSKR
jgi:hypothetical protein